MTQTWTLDAALLWIREMQPKLMEAGWCIMLGGGVLNKGHSDSDLDLLAYPRNSESKFQKAVSCLPKGSLSFVDIAAIYTFYVDSKKVELIFQQFCPSI